MNLYPKKQGAGKYAGRAILSLSRLGIALSPRTGAAFSFHQVGQNIVDAGQVSFALAAQPIEHLRIEADAHRPPLLPEGANENSPGWSPPRRTPPGVPVPASPAVP